MKSRRLFARACAVLFACFIGSFASAQTAGTALVRHAPAINSGTVDGSVQQMLAESITLNGGGVVTGDLFVPGTPMVRLNGKPSYGGTLDGTGATTPTNYQVTLNGNVRLGHVVRRTNAVTIPAVSAPPLPTGTRSIVINSSGQSAGDFATLRHLTLNGNVGQLAIPPGTYGDFAANGGSGFTLGIAGATQPSVYNFQRLTLNGQTQLQVVGPVIVNVANGFAANGALGAPAGPSRLTINIYSGGFTLNGGCSVYGYVNAPNGTVIVNGNSQLIGGVSSDRLTINGGGLLRLQVAQPTNQPPIAIAQSVAVQEDTAKLITLAGTDADGNALTFTIVTSPAHGVLTPTSAPAISTSAVFTYTPAANFNGADSFTFKVNDGAVDSALATVGLTIEAGNDAPIADAKTIPPFDEDTSASIVLTGSDIEGSPLTFTVTTGPQHGILTGTGASRTYIPHANYSGNDQFFYVANDGIASSIAPALVTLAIRPINDAPVAASITRSGTENTNIAITLSGTDIENAALTFTVLSQPAHGTLTGTPPDLVYRSTPNFSGIDSFTYKANDGQADSSIATVTLAIDNPNDPPTASPQAVAAVEDTPKTIVLTGSDPDGSTLTFEIVTQPLHGTLSGTGATRLYTPEADYNGPDAFTFRVSDGTFQSSTATVTLSVAAVNDQPVADGQSAQTPEDTPVALTLTGYDVEESALAFTILTAPQHGTLTPSSVPQTPNSASFTYTPDANFSGSDSFTYKVTDGASDSTAATVSLNVTPVNDAPVATAQSVTTVEDIAVTLTLAGVDVEGSALTFSIVTPPQQGTYSLIGATFVYTPEANYHGLDSFTFKANDGELDSVLAASVSLTITPQNDAPVAIDQTLNIPENAPSTLTLGAADVDGDALTYTYTQPAHGALTGAAPNLTYTPVPNYVGPDSFTFKATDNAPLDSNTATASIVVYDVNTPPTAANQAFEIDEDTARIFTLTVADADNDGLTYTLITPPANGSLANFPIGATGTAPSITYTPAANFFGTDSFTYQVRDGSATPAQATVTFTVRPVNDAPVGDAQAPTTAEDTPLVVVLTGTDAENAALAYTIIAQPTRGTLTRNAQPATLNSYTYTPFANVFGSDSFTFKVSDGQLESAPATVAITITPVNDAPTTSGQTLRLANAGAVSIKLVGSDIDGDTLNYTIVQTPTHGILTGNPPDLTYTPGTGFVGFDNFMYIVSDGTYSSPVAEVRIEISASGAPPALYAGGERSVFVGAAMRNHSGTVVVNNDEWTLSDSGFSQAPTVAHFARNLANWFKRGETGRFLVYSADFGLTGRRLQDVMLDAGHLWEINSSLLLSLEVLSQYDAIFLDGIAVAPALLHEFVEQGGSVYLCGRGVGADITLWNDFLARYGLSFGGMNPVVGVVAVSSGHPLFKEVTSLFYYNGNTLEVFPPANITNTEVLHNSGSQNLVAASVTARFSVDLEGKFVNASDGFDPSGTVFAWSVLEQAGLVRFANGGALSTRAYFEKEGSYRLRLSATNAVGSSSAELLLHLVLNEPPRVLAGPDITLSSIAETANLNGTIADDNKPIGGPLTLRWSVDEAPELAAAEISSPTAAATTALFSKPGRYQLKLTGSDTLDSVSDYLEARVGVSMLKLPPGAAAWWPFDGHPREVIHDSHTVRGARYVTGKVLKGMRSDGADRPMVLAHPNLDIGTSPAGLSVEFWFKADTKRDEVFVSFFGGGQRGLTIQREWYGGQRLTFRIYDANGVVKMLQTGDLFLTSSIPWSHVVATYDRAGGLARLYLNNVVIASGDWGVAAAQTLKDVYFGWSPDGGGILNGTLDEVTLYRRPLEAIEVAALFRAGTDGKAPPDGDVPPIVNAGPDLQATPGIPVTIEGRVTDDNRPLGAPVALWTVVDGPGVVLFDDENAAVSSVSFSAPGTYLLKLTGSDRYHAPVFDLVEVRVATAVVPIPAGVGAWWPMNGHARDVIHDTHQAELLNGISYDQGKISNGLRFNGSTHRAAVPAHPDLDIGSSNRGFSIEFWFKADTKRDEVFLSYYGAGRTGLIVQRDWYGGQRLAIRVYDADGNEKRIQTGDLFLSQSISWTHVAASYDRVSGRARLYVNGTIVGEANWGSVSVQTLKDLHFGSSPAGGGVLQGVLDEVAIYFRPLFPSEVWSLYSSGVDGKAPPESGQAPIVSAGPDQVVADIGERVSLAGSVADDGKPFGAPLISWSTVAGPGTVTFSDSSSATTEATFSAPGTYLMELRASDRYFMPASDLVEVRVGSTAVPLPAGAVAWWPLNGHLREVLNGGHDLELVNGTGFSAGRVLHGLGFDGTNDFAVTSAHPQLDIGDSASGLSIEFWFQADVKADQVMFSYYGGTGRGLIIHRDWYGGQRLSFRLRDASGGDRVIQTPDLFLSSTVPWTHVAATYDRTMGIARLFVNGSVAASGNWGDVQAQTLKDIYIGASPEGGGGLKGSLDELTLYRRPLSAAEVTQIYHAGAAGKLPPVGNVAPIAVAGLDQSVQVNTPLTLAGTAVDDGLPNPPGALSYEWTKLSGPGTVTFSAATNAGTSVMFNAVGTYVLRFSVGDSELLHSDDVSITVTGPASAPPVVAFREPIEGATLAASIGFELVVRATDSDGTIAKVEFFQGSVKLGEQTAPAAGDPTTYFWPVANGLPIGSYTFTAKATDNTGVSTTSASIALNIIADPGPPFAEILSPSEDGRLTAPAGVTGVAASVLLRTWQLDYRLKASDGAPVEPWTSFATGNSSVGTPPVGSNTPAVSGTLGNFDPTSLINGIYELRLTATDTAGRMTVAGPITVVVEGNMKIGAFSLAFEDLKLPVAGIPITITRTYDSRDTRVGDFGPGWRLALNNIRVQKNRHLGTAWWQTPQSGDGIQFYYVEPQRDRIVTVTMPDGETHRFRAGALVKVREYDPDNASFGVVVRAGKYRFYPIGDTTSKLEPLNTSNQLAEDFWIDGTHEQDLRAEDPGSDPFAPEFNTSRYRLITADGTVFILDEALGLLEMRDLDGNTLVLNRDAQNQVSGVTSTQNLPAAAGGPIARSVTIVRDATGRVDYIRDSAGRDLDYIYDAQGRLASFTNRELNVTQFRYENTGFPYYLTKIIDPRGVTALRSEYDSTTGKLVKQIDADGKETIFNRGIDSTGRFEKVKDRLGNETTFYYDDRGNVTLKIDPLGAQTNYSYYPDSDWVKFETDHYGNVKSMAYDARGNVTVQTIGASTSENPASPTTGYTTRTTYNTLSAPTQITDPDGRVQSFTYDPATNNLLTHTLGVGGPSPVTTLYTYHSDGTLATITDALGNTTNHTYNYAFNDAAYPGAVKQTTVTLTDPAGAAGSDPANVTATVLRTTRTLVDAQENQLAQVVSRTLPDGSSEDVVTRYIYDAENRLKATMMPDGRVSETRYTSFGKEDKNVLWKSLADYEAHNDAAARITSYSYDTRGNQVSITHADGTTESMAFDLENRKTWSQDRRGYRTFFSYDDVGRLRFTIHPDASDGTGAAAPTTPADSRVDDNSRTETRYDLIGRVRFQIDERGAKTEFTYEDGCGCAMRRKQMIQHHAAGNLVTHYQYDQAGNVRFVTDPRGNIVETRYDEQGRPRVVVYPATDEHPSTQTETKYDAVGRRAEVIDQEGKTTRYRYDALGRLVEVRQYLDASAAPSDADFSLTFSDARVAITRYAYDQMGNQVGQTDALGRATTYWTDTLGRRTKRILPKDAAESAFLSETLHYDEWGNLWTRTDFAGKTTTFDYDALNRLKSKTADSTHPSLAYSHAIARIEYDYDANGARIAARIFNASNTQLYTESTPRDERSRLDYKDTAAGRLDYSYYANTLLKDVVSSNNGGVNVGYRYDELNRLEFVDDASTGLPTRTTSYAYNANGSLETMTQPNGVVHTYGYDALNRLRTLQVGRTIPGEPLLHTYDYKLRASGHRRQILETLSSQPSTLSSPRTTTYTYDDLYRLTNESVAGDPNGNNGDIGYQLDKVGNRSSRTSSVLPVSTVGNQTYNARDWLAGDTYNANGSTQVGQTVLGEPPATDTYDFEERPILRTKPDGTTINISYDADGHRIAKNILNASAQPVSSTTWLVDTNNLTGYAQVLEERTQIASPASQTTKVYTYGSDLISQAVSLNSQPASLSYFGYDGHGSTRELTDASGEVTDRYDYDAFGSLVFQSGTTANAYRYCGEQYDADLGLYYLRARYLNTDSGRFWSMDEFEGKGGDPVSLHKYLYANADPLRYRDPSGRMGVAEVGYSAGITGKFAGIAIPTIVASGLKAAAVIALTAVGTGVMIDAAYTVHQRVIAQAKLEAQKREQLRGCPRIVWSKSDPAINEIADHIEDNQTVTGLKRLHKLTDLRYPWTYLIAAANRVRALWGQGSAGRGKSWDEYPFASSMEGGNPATVTVRAVTARQNSVQGGRLRAFYRQHDLKLADCFDVEITP